MNNRFHLLLVLVVAWLCSTKVCLAQFSGFIKPLDCANYTGTSSDYKTSYATLYRDTEDGNYSYHEGMGSHPGVDISKLSNGQSSNGAPIRAVYGGWVNRVLVYNSGDGGWGNCLVIRHENIPDVGTVFSCYGHMSRFQNTWKLGTWINKGDTIGYVGNTGHSTGPHLHFQLDRNYSDYANGAHPYFPSNVNAPDSNNVVLNHTISPMKFVQDHATVADSDIGLYSSERQHFLDCFYRNGGRGPIGNPINGAHWWGEATRVVIQDFRGGTGGDGAIIDNEGVAHTTAYWLHGSIWSKYAAIGGPNSPLQRPLSDQMGAATSKQGTGGSLNRFEGGSVYTSGKWGTFGVYGNIGKAYERAGGTASDYGFPVGDVIYWYDNWYYQWFEGPKQGDWRYIIVWGN